MKYKLEKLPKRMILGLPHKGANDYAEVAKIWQELYNRIGEIEHVTDDNVFYGLCEALEDDDSKINYLAGVEVDKVNYVPEGMQAWYITHKDYLVVTHEGDANTIGETFNKVYHGLLEELKLYPGNSYDFELYTKDFYERDPGVVYLFIPVVDIPMTENKEAKERVRKELYNEETARLAKGEGEK